MRKVLVGACVVSMVSLSMAQHLEVGVNGGYGLGVGTALVGHNSEMNANYTPTKYEEIYSPGGAGVKIMGEVTYFLNENMGIMVASGYSTLGGYSMEMKQPLDTVHNTIHSGYLPINLGVKFKVKMGIIEPSLYLAPGVYFPKRDSSYIHFMDLGSFISRDTTKVTYHYTLGWGVSAGIGAVLMVSEKVGITLEVTPTYAFAKQTKYVWESKGITKTTVFQDDKPKLSDDQGSTTYAHDAPHDSYSSIAVKAGVCFRVF
jgi:hypothetical protein